MTSTDFDRRRRLAIVRAAVGAVVLVGAALLVLGAHAMSSDLKCEADVGDSNYGEADWAWWPVGTSCRWTEERNGFDRVDEIGWGPTVIVGCLLILGVGLLASSLPQIISDSRSRS